MFVKAFPMDLFLAYISITVVHIHRICICIYLDLDLDVFGDGYAFFPSRFFSVAPPLYSHPPSMECAATFLQKFN